MAVVVMEAVVKVCDGGVLWCWCYVVVVMVKAGGVLWRCVVEAVLLVVLVICGGGFNSG